jgi:tRNA (guanine-N7-)-methyltransferase
MSFDAIELSTIFEENQIEKIYLNFSDPWPKKKHAKRRLTSSKFLDEYKKVLKEHGKIEFKTDNRGLFEYSLVSMQNYGLKFIEVYLDLHKTEVFNVETEYEKKFSPFGPIYKIIVEY